MTIINHKLQSDKQTWAEACSILEAEALTLFSLEAEALIKKPKPGYLYNTNGCKVEALVNHEAEAFENHEAELIGQSWKWHMFLERTCDEFGRLRKLGTFS